VAVGDRSETDPVRDGADRAVELVPGLAIARAPVVVAGGGGLEAEVAGAGEGGPSGTPGRGFAGPGVAVAGDAEEPEE